MQILVVLSALLAVSLAQTDEPCTLPNQFTSNIVQIYNGGNGCNVYSFNGVLYYDYPNQRLRVDQTGSIQSDTFTVSAYLDFGIQEAYYFNRDTNDCDHVDFNGVMNNPEIPADSSYEGTFMIGTQVVNSWYIPDYDDDDINEVLAVTDSTCFPVSDVLVNTTTNQVAIQQTFYNFLPGLPPFYFDLPAQCTSSKKSVGTASRHAFNFAIPF